METFEERVAATERMLLNACEERGFTLAGDRSVCEADAERLLAYQPGALKRQRDTGTCRLHRRQVGNRWRYRIADIAAEFESRYFE